MKKDPTLGTDQDPPEGIRREPARGTDQDLRGEKIENPRRRTQISRRNSPKHINLINNLVLDIV